MSIKKKLLGNGIAVIFQKSVRVLEQLILVPFFITAWGAAYYGEWITLTIIPNIFVLSDLGFGTAAANYFVLKYAGGARQEAADVSKSGFRIITIVILVGLLVTGGVLFVLGEFNVFDKSLIDKNEAITAVSILILARLLAFYVQLFEAYYRAARRASLSINLITLQSFFNIVAGFFVLLAGYGIVMFAISQLIVTLIFVAGYGLYSSKLIDFSKEGITGVVKKEDIKAITSKGLGYLMSPIWQAIFFQGTTFVVRIVLGAESVVVFNTIRSLTRSVNQLINMLDTIIFPEMQYEIGLNNISKAAKLYRTAMIVAIAIAGAGVVFLMIFGLWFYGIWTNNQLVVSKSVWSLLIIGILFNAMWWLGGVVFRAYNQPFKYTIAGTICSLISVCASYVLASLYGMVGIAIGCLLLEVLMAAYVLPSSLILLNTSLADFFTQGKDDIRQLSTFINKKFQKK